MALYISEDDVKVRLLGKVKFTDDPEDQNKMHTSLLKRLVREGEGQVEMDLSPRYELPFQGINGEAFKTIPNSPSRDFIRRLCEIQAVVAVLETDFGRGSVVNGDEYASRLRERYKAMIDQHMQRWEEKAPNLAKAGWVYPPMRGLRLAYFNTEADDGYAGMVIVTGHGADQAFPREQINDPAQNWTNGTFEELL